MRVTLGIDNETDLRAQLDRLRAELAREERISRALREVGNALGTTLDLDDLLELILGRLTDLLDADRSTLFLVDEAKGDLVSRLVIGDRVQSIRVKVGHGIAGTVAQTGKSVRVADAYKDPRFVRQWDLLTGYRTTSMLATPLKNHLGRTIGVIQVLNKRHGSEFTFEDEAILTALSTQAAVAIDNSRLFLSLIQKNRQLLDTKDQLERRVRDVQLLFELERSTGRAATIEELARATLGAVSEACDACGAALLLSEEESGDLVQYVFDATKPDHIELFGVKAGEGLTGAAMQEDALVQVANPGVDPRQSESVEGKYTFHVQSALCVPLEGEDRPAGALGLFSKRGARDFSPEDVALLELVSANVSTAVRLFRANASRERGERLTTIGRLLSQVIHDFKTPMTVISGHVQLMQNATKQEKRDDHARRILEQFDALKAMQREVLEFARGEKSIFVRRVYLHKFMNGIRHTLEYELDGRAVELEMTVDSQVVARFDETRVARAVHNLCRNAIEAMSARGGTLSIAARMEGTELLIEVGDTGPGIPADVQGRLFQSFVTAGKKDGTGLGLAIVKKIVDEHAGRIETSSSDAGACFRLFFPQVAPDHAAPPLSQRPAKRAKKATKSTKKHSA